MGVLHRGNIEFLGGISSHFIPFQFLGGGVEGGEFRVGASPPPPTG